MAYITSTYPGLTATARPDFSNDSDLPIIDISSPRMPTTYVYNIYNESRQDPTNLQHTIERKLIHNTPQPQTVLTGDMNAHHPWWNTTRKPQRGNNLVAWAEMNDVILLNEPDIRTYMSRSHNTQSVLDLIFITPDLDEFVINWAIDEEALSR